MSSGCRKVISMTGGPLYDNQSEMKLHTEAIRRIVLHYHDIPEEKVTRLYEIVLRRYKAEARVKDFLAVLVGRRVAQLLQKCNGRIFKKL
jgi:hypothetical protein